MGHAEFKAGVKEVVKWIEHNVRWLIDGWDSDVEEEYQAKLKEWGLKGNNNKE